MSNHLPTQPNNKELQTIQHQDGIEFQYHWDRSESMVYFIKFIMLAAGSVMLLGGASQWFWASGITFVIAMIFFSIVCLGALGFTLINLFKALAALTNKTNIRIKNDEITIKTSPLALPIPQTYTYKITSLSKQTITATKERVINIQHKKDPPIQIRGLTKNQQNQLHEQLNRHILDYTGRESLEEIETKQLNFQREDEDLLES